MENTSNARLDAPSISRPSASPIEVDSIHTEEREEQADDLSSLTSSIVDYEYENGRRYHAYKAGHYPMPNDETELDRLDLQHHVITLLLDGELHLAPLQDPKRILDIGTGTGLWAIEMAERYSNASVIGTDLSPIQPNWVPSNVSFEIDDLESEWLYPTNHFDLVHSRMMICSISNWKRMIANAYKHCKPGGFLEIQEFDPTIFSDDGTDAASVHHKEFVRLMCQASKEYGVPIPGQKEFKPWIEEAGFVDVKEYQFKMPVNSWPKDKKLKEVGRLMCMVYSEGLEAIGVGLFTRVLKWQPMEISVFLARIRKELKDRDIHVYQTVTVAIGRKPFPHEVDLKGRQSSSKSETQNSQPASSHTRRDIQSPGYSNLPQFASQLGTFKVPSTPRT